VRPCMDGFEVPPRDLLIEIVACAGFAHVGDADFERHYPGIAEVEPYPGARPFYSFAGVGDAVVLPCAGLFISLAEAAGDVELVTGGRTTEAACIR
jgi:hypothetical protein